MRRMPASREIKPRFILTWLLPLFFRHVAYDIKWHLTM